MPSWAWPPNKRMHPTCALRSAYRWRFDYDGGLVARMVLHSPRRRVKRKPLGSQLRRSQMKSSQLNKSRFIID